jgi:hypothetical protein
MNVLAIIRQKAQKEEALRRAQKQLCYRGVIYVQQPSKAAS